MHEAEGELVELGSRKSGARKATLDEKETFYRELKWVQAHKGHRSGWCWHQYQERFRGERPPKWFETADAARAVHLNPKLVEDREPSPTPNGRPRDG